MQRLLLKVRTRVDFLPRMAAADWNAAQGRKLFPKAPGRPATRISRPHTRTAGRVVTTWRIVRVRPVPGFAEPRRPQIRRCCRVSITQYALAPIRAPS
jgi:hypothetical protein